MRFLHAMLRAYDLDATLRFFSLLGLHEKRRHDHDAGRFTLVFLSTGTADDPAEIELTWNWDQNEPYSRGRSFGHLAFEVDDVYALCAHLAKNGVTISRPPRDGRMAFVVSPDGASVELLQRGPALAPSEPWTSMPNVGTW